MAELLRSPSRLEASSFTTSTTTCLSSEPFDFSTLGVSPGFGLANLLLGSVGDNSGDIGLLAGLGELVGLEVEWRVERLVGLRLWLRLHFHPGLRLDPLHPVRLKIPVDLDIRRGV